MAHPVFAEPMYRALRDISAEFLAPNLGLIPNNTISLLETNQRFIEAYMVGSERRDGPRAALAAVSDRPARQLLPPVLGRRRRGQPRCRRSRPREIEEDLLDITKLHTWDARDVARRPREPAAARPGAEPGDARLVLVVRGDLLKKYPTAVIYAQQAKWTTDEQGRDVRVLDDSDPGAVRQDAGLQGGDRSGCPLPRLRSHRERREGQSRSRRPTTPAGSS